METCSSRRGGCGPHNCHSLVVGAKTEIVPLGGCGTVPGRIIVMLTGALYGYRDNNKLQMKIGRPQ
jgi:hypothetical protein